MISDLKPYPAMKDSGVEWLGEVPEHWEVLPLTAVGRPKSIAGLDGRELLSVYLDRGVIRFSDVQEKRTNVTSEDLSKYQAVDPGDFVLNNQQAWRGSVGVSRLTGIVSPAYLVLALSDKLNAEYANLLLRERAMVSQYLIASRGVGSIQRNLYWPHLKRAITLVPPLPEQAAIVRYLDHVDRRVRRLTRAKRKLIALLTEQKQAIIHRAVTRGLDPDVPLKDSGVEWLGEVPVHWEVRRLRNTAEMRVSNVDKHTREEEQPVRLCNYVDVYKNDHIDEGMDFMRASATDPEIKRFRLEAGDVLITKDSESWDDIGVPALVTRPADDLICGYHLALLRPFREHLEGGYLFRALQSKGLAYQLHVEARGVTRYGLSHSGIKSAWTPLPPLPEQAAIAVYLDRATADIDTAIIRAEREIELLAEYRTGLIADVVTGKLDVRDAAADLPQVDPLAEADKADDLDAVPAMDAAELDEVPEEAEA